MKERSENEREATGKEIIEAIVGSMIMGLEPLYTKTLAPGLFQVYLREKDYVRLKGIFNELQSEAALALDDKVAALNKSSRRGFGPMFNKLVGKIKPALENMPEEMRPLLTGKFKSEGECVRPQNGWQLSFYKNEDENSEPGDIVVEAMLMMPERPELGGGMTTKSVKTLYRAGASRITNEKRESAPPPAAGRITLENRDDKSPSASTLIESRDAAPTGHVVPPAAEKSPFVYAVLRYRDNDGDQVFEMTKPNIVVGRGGTGVWVDIKLNTLPDVSREHLRIRRDETNSQFYLKDVSTLGTTIDGQTVPPAMESAGDKRIDKDVWVSLPKHARIGLAGVLTIEFDAR